MAGAECGMWCGSGQAALRLAGMLVEGPVMGVSIQAGGQGLDLAETVVEM